MKKNFLECYLWQLFNSQTTKFNFKTDLFKMINILHFLIIPEITHSKYIILTTKRWLLMGSKGYHNLQ